VGGHGINRTTAAALVCAAVLLGLTSVAQGDDLRYRLVRDYVLYSADPRYGDVLEVLQRKAAGRGRVAVIGTFNEMSDSLVRWSMAQGPAAERIHLTCSLPRTLPGEELRRRLRSWLEEEKPQRILALRLLPRSPLFHGADFQRYNAWQLDAIETLLKDPAWVRRTRRVRFHHLDLEVLVLDRRSLSPASPASSPTAHGR
jgi:hypothetical protein